MGNWYADESKHIQDRRAGIEKFFIKVTNHRRICGSDDLASFLKDTDATFEDRKKSSEDLINSANQSYTAISTIKNFLSNASEKL